MNRRVSRCAAGLVRVAVMLCTMSMGCKDATPPPPPPPELATTFVGQERQSMTKLSEQPWFGVLESVDAHDLFSYLSGSFVGGGHAFPVLYFDPATQKFWVKGPRVEEIFDANALDEAFGVYTTLLVDKGYSMPDRKDRERPTVTVNGEKMMVVKTEDLFPSSEKAQSHFSGEQWQVLYSDLGGWQGFTYLSGVGTDSRDYPLLVGIGWLDTARLRVMGKETAEEFAFDSVEEAFEAYRKVVSQRVRKPTAPSTVPPAQ